MERRYAIGLDYGTLSVRALLLDIDSSGEPEPVLQRPPAAALV